MIAFALNIWFNIVARRPETVMDHMWLAQLQEPGTRTGEWVLHTFYPLIGNPWTMRWAVISAYGAIVVLWTVVIAAVLILGRIIVAAKP